MTFLHPTLIQREAACMSFWNGLWNSAALHELSNKARAIVPLECPPAPTQRIVMGPEFFNNYHQADVIFIVEGREFPAHKFCLQLASDAFRAMFDGGYLESDAKMIPIPNIPYTVFQAMMHCIYTGKYLPGVTVCLKRRLDTFLHTQTDFWGCQVLCPSNFGMSDAMESCGSDNLSAISTIAWQIGGAFDSRDHEIARRLP